MILSNNLFGTEIDPRAGSLAAFALTMKARAKQRTFFTNTVKPHICVLEPISFTPEELDALVTPGGNRADEEEFWQQFEHADTFGSLILSKEYLIRVLKTHLLLNPPADMLATELHERSQRVLGQAEYLSKRFHVVVANPPYMGSKNMAVRLREFASREYSVSKADLMTMFMERARTLVLVGGVWAMINLPTWMYLSSFIALRKLLLRDSTIISLVQFGRGIFGSDFGSVAFVMSERPPSASTRGVYRRLFNRGVEVRSNETIRQLFLDPSFNKFDVRQGDLELLPGSPIAFGLDGSLLQLFGKRKLSDAVRISAGISTGDNSRFIRLWHEVSADRVHVSETDTAPWKLHNKGGAYRKWYGNIEHVLKYSPESVREMEKLLGFRHDGKEVYLRAHVSWSEVTSGRPSFRYYPSGMTFGSGSKSIFDDNQLLILLGYLNSQFIEKILAVLSPGIRLDVGQIAGLPMPDLGKDGSAVEQLVRRAIALGRSEWDANESSFDFKRLHVLDSPGVPLEVAQLEQARRRQIQLEELDVIERDVDRIFVEALSVEADRGHLGNEIVAPIDESAKPDAETDLCTDHRSPDDDVLGLESSRASVIELVSYAVGCMFGRYSLDLPGLVLASQGETLRDYLGRVPAASFLPDADNVIPIIDGEWFEDDIVARFRLFLRVAFGGEQFEDNLRFVEDVLGKDIRKYFVADFYKDHLQRYKKRPIYWLFSSPKGSFNALIYMHRYTSSTVSTVLNDYLREYRHKLDSERENQERMSGSAKSPRDKARADKEVDRIRKVQLELEAYEHDVLYPLATQQITIDLDDGVKVNYPKFGSALKKIPGLEATDE